MENGKLYICPTPIGNLDDMTIRGVNTLKMVDIVAAEDTRHSLKLLNHFEIKNKLISYHEHNKKSAGIALIDRLLEGKNVALVSDAGMPGISDPGEDLVKLCIENGIEVIALPGASAVVTALAASGLSTRYFHFEGFLEKHKKTRNERLEYLSKLTSTLVFYESPHRLLDTLKVFQKVFGNRQMVAARELTKRYEEYVRGSIEDCIQHFSTAGVKGEFVLLVAGNDAVEVETFDTSIEEHLLELMAKGLTKKEATTEVSKKRKLPKKEVYQVSINLKK
ncbi:16S rRNA (cytidine(1402)-2'-O)-methyltransferase [Acidaminobacter sp. JC074]|uniref:16S rRNA (cytidine(1402)-2'-O)-methyltransferase n=1 Tax=Acidaminobacter sp. JC074 TaxID=2530199 RepID=UPI001F0EDEAB|nr:16S rRNA (cytidine(1402)-2'-O)-methyltransferase [Acidaminobacter sp. JC074]MCH4887370.1 16S rRNA (cytidine(1402)-2'-O)-methyltransferase [Acidaminobacter sp. JC074]